MWASRDTHLEILYSRGFLCPFAEDRLLSSVSTAVLKEVVEGGELCRQGEGRERALENNPLYNLDHGRKTNSYQFEAFSNTSATVLMSLDKHITHPPSFSLLTLSVLTNDEVIHMR